jgi:membrane associated rhomboid family serine protease
VLIAICVADFVAMTVLGGGGSFEPSGATLMRFGAMLPSDVWEGKWWEMLSAGINHANLLHIGFNLLAIYTLGQAIEQVLSPLRTAVLYLGAQLGCTAASLCFGSNVPHMGASGMAFGMLGGIAVALFRRRDPMALAGRRMVGMWLAQSLIFSILPGIDMLGHLGGLFAGAALMSGLEPSKPPQVSRLISLLGAVALIAVAVYFGLQPRVIRSANDPGDSPRRGHSDRGSRPTADSSRRGPRASAPQPRPRSP